MHLKWWARVQMNSQAQNLKATVFNGSPMTVLWFQFYILLKVHRWPLAVLFANYYNLRLRKTTFCTSQFLIFNYALKTNAVFQEKKKL